MKLDRFLEERGRAWDELESLIRAARSRPERLGPAKLLQLGTLYRGVAADLAFARRSWPRDPAIARLEDLVTRSRPLVYDAPKREGTFVGFVTRDYWRRVHELATPILVAFVLLLGPAVWFATWAANDPARAVGFVPVEFRDVQDPRDGGTDLRLSPAEQAAFSSSIMTNNIGVGFLAFATGISAGIGTSLLLVFNGSVLGSVAGLAAAGGNGATFAELVLPHGVLEISLIAVAAGAGLRMGWVLISPGPRPRGKALVAEARPSVEIAIGTAAWFGVAAAVEGFVTPRGVGLPAAALIGSGLAIAYWLLVILRGASDPHS